MGLFSQRRSLSSWVALSSFFWMMVGNLIGVLLSVLLLWPELNQLLSPYTYGRWVPLHLDFQLYGWCSLPLLSLLFWLFLHPKTKLKKWGFVMVGAWSVMLALAGWDWIHGKEGGKIFLEWSGAFRWGFPIFLGIFWLFLLIGFIEQMRFRPGTKGRGIEYLGKSVFLFGLGGVPFVFYQSLSPDVYPAINHASGGPTGTNLLGSILAVVVLFWGMPLVLDLKKKDGRGFIWITAGVLVIHFLVFSVLPHGNIDFSTPIQTIGLGSALVWIPILKWYLGKFKWPSASRWWLASFAFWGILLCVTGVALFMPGILDRFKFTNILVAHAHLAMAGMMTSFNFLLLIILNPSSKIRSHLKSKKVFSLWHLGLLLYLVSLSFFGIEEGTFGMVSFRGFASIPIFYGLRFIAGLFMFAASWIWFEKIALSFIRPEPEAQATDRNQFNFEQA